jgi:FG-GAP-like repeat/IPT/TIG domain/FG-GAP repeat
MKTIFTLILCGILIPVCFSQPQISSFLPASAPAGTTVTISGSNFNPGISANTVYFGAVKATVISASTTSLSVQVPTGATYSPITVTANGLTGYSRNYFSLSYSGGGQLNNFSLSSPVQFTTDLKPNGVVVADFDGDGKADLATPNNYSTSGQPSTISVLRNTSTAQEISMAPKLDLPNGPQTYAAASGDIDGDGKPDIVACSITDQNIAVFRNTSSVGSISFAPRLNYASGDSPQGIAIGDMDGDGRPDIVVVNTLGNSISVFRNTTSGSSISFAAKIDFSTELLPRAVVVADFDGDGQTDIAVSNNLSFSYSIFRNISSIGNVALATPQHFLISTGHKPAGLVVFDFNADNKPDLGALVNQINGSSNAVCQMYRNTSSTGTISFTYAYNVSGAVASSGYYLSAGDINGDGKVDLAMPVTFENFTNTFENLTTAGSSQTVFFSPNGPFNSLKPYGNALADLNGDNKPELITTDYTGTSLSVFQNKCGFPVINDFYPQNGSPGSIITLLGFNFTGTTAVSFGGFPASSFTVVSPTKITAVVANGASGPVSVTNGIGAVSAPGFIYSGPPAISSFSPVNAGVGQTITINGSFSGTVTGVSFGGVPAASFTVVSSNKITAVTGNGATGNVSVTTNMGTGTAAGFTFFPMPAVSAFSPTSGFTGTVVNISGSNFTGATAVKIGGRDAASFTVLSPTSISAVVGNGATGSVSVTTPGGTSSHGLFEFPPVTITNFSPASGPAGAQVTITGNHFSSTPSANFVYFGAARATVIAASTNALTALVPAGTTNQPITVTANGTTAYFNQPFRLTFAGADTTLLLNATSFKWQLSYDPGYDPSSIRSLDIDGDGKVDHIIRDAAPESAVLLYRNTSVSGNISFAPPITIAGPTYSAAWQVSVADFNSDGKTDLVISNLYGASYSTVSVFINTSSPGSISFAPKIDLPLLKSSVVSVATDDFDGDAKPDLVALDLFADNNKHVISIFRNTTINGNTSFNRIDRTITGIAHGGGMLAGDLDNDNKTDLIFRDSGSISLSVMPNISTAGNFNFGPLTSLSIQNVTISSITDLDNDTKPDLITRPLTIPPTDTHIFSVIKNTSSSPGIFSFGPKINYNNGIAVRVVKAGELNGDGRADLVVNYDAGLQRIATYRNNSSGGVIAFDTAQIYRDSAGICCNAYLSDIDIADLDGDGKTDISNSDGRVVAVYRNRIKETIKIQLCPAFGNGTLPSGLAGAAYQWKVDTGSGFVNITDNANYSGTNAATLQLNNIPSSWYGYQYVCVANNVYSNIFSLQFVNTWTGAVNFAWENPANWSCGVVPDSNTDVVINSGTVSVNSSTTIRSLTLQPGVNLFVLPNVTLTILR